ncbi:radical SAM family heme chaperone HemW [Candidatus Ruminimicrobium bovinum]|uniref:radical SAM family heme chaperone HemW n=1 Tax=Candidatus Ruminimicrobium bovinum TaxID=3242779 RepID=UPI0039B98352
MLGLYIHIPFCKKKCFYCDFISFAETGKITDSYIDSLIKEASFYLNEKISTIYIGGGTPSILTVKQLNYLVKSIKQIFDISNLEEFTVELNPESANDEKLNLLFDLNVSRLSLGLQSIYDKYLEELGRLHNFNKFLEVYNNARKTGFTNINIDLMYGIEKQSILDWKKTLKKIIELNPEHISLYPLTIEENTVFYEQNKIVDTNLQRQMYETACSVLNKNNFIHYEISNWAKDNKFSKHNCLYWKNKEYIGLGVSACSYYKRHRTKNTIDLQDYIQKINEGKKCFIEEEYIDDILYQKETVMLGLRLTEGVDLKYFDNKKEILYKYLKENLLQIKNNKISLTEKSFFISNPIIAELM